MSETTEQLPTVVGAIVDDEANTVTVTLNGVEMMVVCVEREAWDGSPRFVSNEIQYVVSTGSDDSPYESMAFRGQMAMRTNDPAAKYLVPLSVAHVLAERVGTKVSSFCN
jgi:hypothetical protein